jgi:hypothetical protein
VGPINVTLQGVDDMQRELERIAKRSVPFAARETVNNLAWEGRTTWQQEMRESLTLRNKFTERRALVVPTRGLRISTMEATLGHTEPYMGLLETGGRQKANKVFRAIPTETAAGQAKGSLMGGRKSLVRASLMLKKFGTLALKGATSRNRKSNNARAVRGALRSGQRIALLDMGKGGKGIYRIKGSKRKPEILKLYDLTRRSTKVPRIPTLARTLKRTLLRGPAIAYAALEKQLMRAGAR